MLESRPGVGELIVELEDVPEDMEVRVQDGENVWEVVGLEFDEDDGICYINLGAKFSKVQ